MAPRFLGNACFPQQFYLLLARQRHVKFILDPLTTIPSHIWRLKNKQHLGNATPWNFVPIRNIYDVQFARKWVTNTLLIGSKFFVGKGGRRQAIFYESAFNVKAGVFSWSLVFGFKEEGFTLTRLDCKTMTAYSRQIFIVKWDTIWSNLHVNLRVKISLEEVIISS